MITNLIGMIFGFALALFMPVLLAIFGIFNIRKGLSATGITSLIISGLIALIIINEAISLNEFSPMIIIGLNFLTLVFGFPLSLIFRLIESPKKNPNNRFHSIATPPGDPIKVQAAQSDA